MKKFRLLFLFALTGALSTFVRAAAPTRAELVTRVESCEAILQEFQANPATAIPASVLQSARGIIIVNQFKAGFLLGIKDGYAVIMVKRPTGWSLPVLLTASEVSLGLQLGAKADETIMILTDDQTPRLLFNQRFNVGVDAKAVGGPKSAARERDNHPIVDAPVLVYSKSKGLFAGATVKAGHLARNDEANFTLYNTEYTLPELLYSDWVKPTPEVQPIINLITKLSP